MLTRRVALQTLLAGTTLIAGARLLSGRGTAAHAGNFEVTHTDEEWRKLLTPAQYNVLRKAGTERPYSSALFEGAPDRELRLRGLRSRSLFLHHQIRERHRLAEFLEAAR